MNVGSKNVSMAEIWVEKYKPKTSSQIMGQIQNVNRLKDWLRQAPRNKFKAVLMSGPPGIGKTTTAQLVCREVGYRYIELNASDTRSKKTIEEQLSVYLKNSTLNLFGAKTDQNCVTKNCLIMDEVDGMSGNEDRGGIAQLIQFIKSTKIPIICICNDAQHPKVRSLANYCEHLIFHKPRKEQVRGVVMSIAHKEGLIIDQETLFQLIESANCDIRQVINYLSLFKKTQDSSVNEDIKTVRLSTFDATKSALTDMALKIHERFELFFTDYGIMPLFIHENYLHAKPEPISKQMKMASRAIDSMCLGDLIDKEIREHQSWSMLPTQALYSTVIPSYIMKSPHLIGRLDFPSFLGRTSNTNKRLRLVQDLKSHMSLVISGGRESLVLDYMDTLRDRLSIPLINQGTDGIDQVLEFMETYSLRREDIDTIMELSTWPHQQNPFTSIDSKVKSALTRNYNKANFILPYSVEASASSGKRHAASIKPFDFEGEGEVDEEEEEEDLDIPKPKKHKKNPHAAAKAVAVTKKEKAGPTESQKEKSVATATKKEKSEAVATKKEKLEAAATKKEKSEATVTKKDSTENGQTQKDKSENGTSQMEKAVAAKKSSATAKPPAKPAADIRNFFKKA